MGDDQRDPPIIELEYLSGLKVVDIGDLRVARGQSRRPASACEHKRVRYDAAERRIWCSDCERDVEPFDAFRNVAEQYAIVFDSLNARAARLAEAEAFQARTLAARKLDQAWRSRTTIPACPSCGQGLFPEDFKDGVKTTLGRDYAERRRAAMQKK